MCSGDSLDDLQGDLIAGVTVGLTLIPQAIAYAGIAQLGPQVGFGLCDNKLAA